MPRSRPHRTCGMDKTQKRLHSRILKVIFRSTQFLELDTELKLFCKIDSIWRNRDIFLQGHEEIIDMLRKKWAKEKEYILRKELFAYTDNRLAVQFWYEFRDASDSMKWKRCCKCVFIFLRVVGFDGRLFF